MKLNNQLKWRLNELLALRELPEGGEAWRQRFKALCTDVTPACAAEIMSARPGDELYSLSRRRKLWATLGYVFIVLFLITVAAFVLCYWLISEHRVGWMGGGVLVALLAGAALGIGAMLLSANRVTRIQNDHIRQAVKAILAEYDAMPADEAARVAGTLRQGFDRGQGEPADLSCGCCACGALLGTEDFDDTDPSEERCPRCGAQYQLVFGTGEAPLDDAFIHRLQSYLKK